MAAKQFLKKYKLTLPGQVSLSAVFLSLFFTVSSCQKSYLKPSSQLSGHDLTHDAHVEKLSTWLNILQRGLYEKYKIDTVYIGGGSSRAILDYFYSNKQQPLVMRDFDVFLVAHQKIDSQYARELGETIAKTYPLIGSLSVADLRPRPRVNPTLPPPENFTYNAGYGFFFLKGDDILDLSIYHTMADLGLNGIFDVDTVMIPLRYDTSLLDFFTNTLSQSKDYDILVQSGKILDKHRGYQSWRQKAPKVVKWGDIERDPMLGAIRVIRTFGKVGVKTPDTQTMNTIKQLIASEPQIQNRLQIVRNLLKLLEDKNFASEIRSLWSLGFFRQWQISLHRILTPLDTTGFEKLVKHCNDAVCRLKSLVRLTTPQEQEQIIADLKLVDPTLMAICR